MIELRNSRLFFEMLAAMVPLRQPRAPPQLIKRSIKPIESAALSQWHRNHLFYFESPCHSSCGRERILDSNGCHLSDTTHPIGNKCTNRSQSKGQKRQKCTQTAGSNKSHKSNNDKLMVMVGCFSPSSFDVRRHRSSFCNTL